MLYFTVTCIYNEAEDLLQFFSGTSGKSTLIIFVSDPLACNIGKCCKLRLALVCALKPH